MQLDGTTGNNNSLLNLNQWRIQGRTDRVAFIRSDGDTEKSVATLEIRQSNLFSSWGTLPQTLIRPPRLYKILDSPLF